MIATTAMNPARLPVPSRTWRSAPRGTDSRSLFAAGLFLVVLIVEAPFIAITAPTSLDVGTLYVTVT
jgi:hypothetical protein